MSLGQPRIFRSFAEQVCFDPGTLALLATTALVAGTGIAAVGAVRGGREAQANAQVQSAILQQRADSERATAADEERDFRRSQIRLMADRRARLGATGVELGEGSPLLVSEDLAGESELQALRIRTGGQTRATRLEQEASLIRTQGRQQRTAGVFRAGSLLLSGAGAAFGRSR